MISIAESTPWKRLSFLSVNCESSPMALDGPLGHGRRTLAGGWGYGNLGDSAILSGYLLDGAERGIRYDILSVNPRETKRSITSLNLPYCPRVLDESWVALRSRIGLRPKCLVLGGGGYLNGTWTTEIAGKLKRIEALSRAGSARAHSIEVRRIASDYEQSVLQSRFRERCYSVRDEASLRELSAMGMKPRISPDAISLLAPYINQMVRRIAGFEGYAVLNLMDLRTRNDLDEAEIDTSEWVKDCRALMSETRGPKIGLAIDNSDREFMENTLGIKVLRPTTVLGLVSILGGARALISTRMHPGLLGSMLGVPTRILPYCGKVRPTVSGLGLNALVQESRSIASIDVESIRPISTEPWMKNYRETAECLYENVFT